MAQNGEVKSEPMEQGAGGDSEAMDTQEPQETNGDHTEDYEKLVNYGIDSKVAAELEVIYKSGKKNVMYIVCYVILHNNLCY